MMKVRIILFNQHWFHLCAAAEAIMLHKKVLESVEIVFIRSGLEVWPLDAHFPSQFKSISHYSPEHKLFEFLRDELINSDIKVSIRVPRVSPAEHELENNQVFNDFSELRRFKFKSHPVGMAISSYLISMTKSSTPPINKYKNLIRDLYATYFQIQEYLTKFIFSSNTDEIWLCNGRQLHERSVVEFGKLKNIPIKFFEIGGDGNALARWILHEHSPHDRLEFQREIQEYWIKREDKNSDVLHQWFNDKLNPDLNPFTSKQIRNLELDLNEKYIVFYTSSDDEVAAISEDWDSPWGSQIDAAQMLIDFFGAEEEIKLVIRVHPNILNKSKSDQLNWKKLIPNKNVVIIPPDSRIDSYSLLSKAKGIFTFGSTIGIEAVYWGRPLGLLSRARYDIILDNQYIDDKEKLTVWVSKAKSGRLKKPSQIGSLMWANYSLTAGNPWEVTRLVLKRKRKIGFLGNRKMRPSSVVVLTSRILNQIHSYF